MKKNEFRDFLREFYSRPLHSLNEAEEMLGQVEPDPGETSLDAQVDRLLMSYEKESRQVKKEGRDFRHLTRRFLSEAEGDEKSPKNPPAGEKLSAEEIDVQKFSEAIVRLVDNYDALLDVRDTLIRRAQEYLSKNYEPQVLTDFKSSMRDQFDVEVGVTDVDKRCEYQAPPAARAGKGTE